LQKKEKSLIFKDYAHILIVHRETFVFKLGGTVGKAGCGATMFCIPKSFT
jgi:hypothetical protein